MFFVSEHLVNRVTDTNITPGYRTDHSAITLTVKTKQEPRGNGLWMFNTSHLLREEYLECIKDCINNTIKQYAVPIYSNDSYSEYDNYCTMQLTITDSLFYETLIMMLRRESVKFAKQTAEPPSRHRPRRRRRRRRRRADRLWRKGMGGERKGMGERGGGILRSSPCTAEVQTDIH